MDGSSENVAIIVVRKLQSRYERFITANQAIGNGFIHQVPRSLQFLACEVTPI
jgi:hypothetical protein